MIFIKLYPLTINKIEDILSLSKAFYPIVQIPFGLLIRQLALSSKRFAQ